jgi:hypothetical protein
MPALLPGGHEEDHLPPQKRKEQPVKKDALDALRARIALLEKVAEAAINYRNNETRDNCEVLEEAIAALDALKEG